MLAKTIPGLLLTLAFAAPAAAANYPISGAYGESKATGKDRVDCRKVRVIDFRGNQRTDTGGGVPAYRNVSVTRQGDKAFKVVDEFSNGQITGGKVAYTLRQMPEDRIELALDRGGTIKLQRCK